MDVRKYQAATMQEAIAEVKRDLGEDALILQTRTIKDRGLFGLFGRPLVEITATPRERAVPAAASPAPAAREASRGAATLLARAYGNAERPTRSAAPRTPTVSAPQAAPEVGAEGATQIEDQIAAIKQLVGDLSRVVRFKNLAEFPEPLLVVYRELRSLSVGDSIAERLIRHLSETLSTEEFQDSKLVARRLERIVHELVEVSGPIQLGPNEAKGRRPRVVSLIGPTGVGKTTTIAKLASHFSVTERRRVGLATIDTYRVAATEQLGQFASILALPIRIVSRPSEMRQVLSEMGDLDLVFIDTAGRSQRDRIKMEELRDFLQVADPDEVHLVLSATTDVRTLLDMTKRFAEVGFDRLLVTKLDEAPCFGFCLDLALAVQKPFSYLTTGQGVPNDIEVAGRPVMARSILGKAKIS